KNTKINAQNLQLPIDQQPYEKAIENNGRRNEPVAKPDAGQTLTAAVIPSDSLKPDAPPKIPTDLNVPLIPSTISGIAPAFFIQQLEDGAKQVVAVPSLFAPKNSAT